MHRIACFILGLLAASAAFGLGLVLRGQSSPNIVDLPGVTIDEATGWRVEVDATSGAHSISHGSFSMTPPWPMRPGWFVLLENRSRAWSYNGDDQLVVLVSAHGAHPGVFDLGVATASVPEAVVRRIGEQRIRALAETARATRERLGLTPTP